VRAVEEWIGKTDDSPVPPRVRLRVFERFGGRCYLSGRLLRPGDPWEIEHVVALSNGGQHREANLAPVCAAAHKVKTAQDRRVKAKTDRIRKKHIGIRKPSRFPGSRDSKWKKKVSGEVVPR